MQTRVAAVQVRRRNGAYDPKGGPTKRRLPRSQQDRFSPDDAALNRSDGHHPRLVLCRLADGRKLGWTPNAFADQRVCRPARSPQTVHVVSATTRSRCLSEVHLNESTQPPSAGLAGDPST